MWNRNISAGCRHSVKPAKSKLTRSGWVNLPTRIRLIDRRFDNSRRLRRRATSRVSCSSSVLHGCCRFRRVRYRSGKILSTAYDCWQRPIVSSSYFKSHRRCCDFWRPLDRNVSHLEICRSSKSATENGLETFTFLLYRIFAICYRTSIKNRW